MKESHELVRRLAKLPGLGPRSARRILFALLKDRDRLMRPLAHLIADLAERTRTCTVCGSLDQMNPCSICAANDRKRRLLCVVAEPSDVWALERMSIHRGLYHVLGGVLNAAQGTEPQDLAIPALLERSRAEEFDEIILALGAHIDAITTAHYVARLLVRQGLRVTMPRLGLPLGGELEYLDEGTIRAAFAGREEAGS